MLHSIVYEMLNLKWMILVYILLIVGVSAIYWIFTSNFKWNHTKIRSFGIIRNFEGNHLYSFALSINRFLFVLVSAIFVNNIGVQQLAVLLLMSVVIGVLEKNLLMAGADALSYTFISAILILENLLYQYYLDVEQNILVIVMLVFLAIFAVLYSAYHLIGTYEKILKGVDKQ